MNEQSEKKQAETRKLAAYRSYVERLPVTMRPSLNQRLNQWDMLFPFEQNYTSDFMKGIESFQPSALDALTAPLRNLETKMGVQSWNFSQSGDTLENASLLARSEYYAEWRHEVQKIFDAVNAVTRNSAPVKSRPARLLLLVLPENLPINAQSMWKQWDPRGHEIKIAGDARKLCQLVLQGQPGLPAIATLLAQQGRVESSDLWFIDAEAKLSGLLSPSSPDTISALSYSALIPFRDRFLSGLNTIPKNIEVADQTVAALHGEDWERWWPAEFADQPRLRNFVIELFLSGNGALIFSNAFVEWAASQAISRARPRVVVARFGMRSKPKPFTSIAIFENQKKISQLPDVDDPENSAIDAAILARYVWLAACRYPEQEQTVCICVSEYQNSAYVIPPAGMSAELSVGRPIAPEEIYRWLGAYFAS